MHDIWNPWHGCKKCSEGCEKCYMYFLDAQRGKTAQISTAQKQGSTLRCQRTEADNTKSKAANNSACV